MKNIAKGLIVAGAMIGTGAASAFCLDDLCPYVGGEYEWTSTSGNRDHHHGRGFAKSYNGGNFFIGGRWCDFGVEVGYDFTQRKNRRHARTFTQDQLANVIGADRAAAFFAGTGNTGAAFSRTRSRFNGWHIDLNGYMPVCDCFELIGQIGYGWMKPHVSSAFALTNNVAGVTLPGFTARGNALVHRLHSRGGYKGVFRLGAGGQYMVTDCVGLRGMLRWKNMNQLRSGVRGDDNFRRHHHKARDAFSLAAGVFVKF